MNVSQALIIGNRILSSKKNDSLESTASENTALEARILLQYILNCSVEFLFLNQDLVLTDLQIKNFYGLLLSRKKNIPISYLTENKEFFSLNFYVNKHVLIPRPDSEILVSAILEYGKISQIDNILDLGTGSGCIIIALLKKLKNTSATALDICSLALNVAKKNIKLHRLEGRINLLESNWFMSLDKNLKFDVIVSNPPYISLSEKEFISSETLLYEPKIALFASKFGLENYYIIAKHAYQFLKNNGQIFLEVGWRQAELVKKIFIKYGYCYAKSYYDLNNRERCLQFCCGYG